MAKKKPEGVCRICGKYGPLSPEHVPPQKAYNKATVIEYVYDLTLTTRKAKGRKQGGVSAHTLCEQCNNTTGSWYADEYVKWSRTGFDILTFAKAHNLQNLEVKLKNVHPLRFLKQVVVCFFSIMESEPAEPQSQGQFARNNPELVNFVLNKHETNLPSSRRFFIKLYGFPILRRSPLTGKMQIVPGEDGGLFAPSVSFYAEIAHPPFAVLMTENSAFPDATEITFFKNFSYDETVDVFLKLSVAQRATPISGSF